MPNSSGPNKQYAAHLAARLIESQELRSVSVVLAEELLQKMADGNVKTASPDGSLSIPSPGRQVGAWIAQDTDDGEFFVRSDALDPAQVFARTERIPPKSNKLRVVLIGESVARGVLYDPHFNCALALQELLNLAAGSDWVEVVDLARSGMTIIQLPEIVESALALKPDAVVIFAGNNWLYHPAVEIDRVIEILRAEQSWLAVMRHIEGVIEQDVRALVSRLSEFSIVRSIPLVFVIPEFNAADWQSIPEWRCPLLTGARGRRWRQLRIEAEKSLASRDYDKVAVLAKSMIDLDGGTSPTPYEMLATCSRELGDHAAARRFFDQAGRIELSLPVQKMPRCYPIIRETLRSECAARAVTIVDLPDKISEFLSGDLPDRTLFIDYCHLNQDGIRLAMACAAEALLPLLGRQARPWRELNRHRFSIDNRILALAHFMAARTNAYAGQSYELVRYHFARAIQNAPEIGDMGILFADINLRRTPYMMCRAFEELMSNLDSLPGISILAAGAPDQGIPLNMLLIQALKDAIAEGRPEAGERIEKILREEYSVQEREINLLSRSSCDLNWRRWDDEWWERSIYLQAREPESRFHLICEKPAAIELKLTCRLNGQPLENEPVSLLVNGRLIGKFMASIRWSRHTLVIPPEALHDGLNSLTLSWPEPRQRVEERIEEIIKNLEDRDPIIRWESLREIYPIYGEIHAFSATLQRELSVN